MTLTQIAKAFRNAIRDSAAIASQCVAYFGKGHSVWYGGGDTSSPLQDNCPAFIIVPESKNPSQIDSQLQFSVKVTLAILEPDPTVIDSSTEYLGSEYLEALLDLAYQAVSKVSSNISLDGQVDLEAFREFPIRMGELDLTATVPRVIGRRQIEL